jgi:rhamnopyranosyl-N-acetylglucosaminyl-diphospho-decaprenol beta-1,3/1,4-galactofuranosyltransferase
MSPSLASVTVAYNAVTVLPRQIDALLRQTRPLREIVVVDNASTDGTAAMLAERYPQVTLLRMSENLGQAGGWSAGLSYAALQKRHDWIWTFDNDSVPAPEAMETLLNVVETLEDTDSATGMVAPIPVHKETETSYLPFLWRDGFIKPSSEQARQPVWFADMVIASGCLVRREVVEQIGLPRADFFIDFCDFEYCLRVRSHGYKIAVVNGVKLDHEIGNARTIRFLGLPRLWASQPPFREYYISRNLAYLAWWLYPSRPAKRSAARFLASRGIQILLFGDRKLACLMRMTQGLRDGLQGRMGIRLRPADDRLQGQGDALRAGEPIKAGRA